MLMTNKSFIDSEDVLDVEFAIKNAEEYQTIEELANEIKKSKKLVERIVFYLQEKNRVILNKEKKIIWIYQPELIKNAVF
ncbi:hypothetical protein COT72_03895 [archaeon CG10_big_fil_rev_8_21_14_0_10_43_11]|nr:MAG: hypothetical protein COT72_03895 [archaeon CG10_big_fil_rev_8_21_14_0_10_43_11]